MAVFNEVKLQWKDKTYVVPADKVLRVIAAIEEEITLDELTRPNVKRAKLAAAYTAALRYIGAIADENEVYSALFSDVTQRQLRATIDALIYLMIPPDRLKAVMPKVSSDTVKKKLLKG